ncbi:MAG: hypothetical protein AB1555_00260 [Nitrospirota bacterium]
MRRTLEPVDLMVVIGLCATLLGGYAVFISANGTLEAAGPETVSLNHSTGIMAGMEWVQPALGQAIVEDYLLERAAAENLATAVSDLNRATMTQHWLSTDPFRHIDAIRSHAAAVAADEAGRIQAVMGRAIVNFTQRGVRSGVLSPAQYESGFNKRMIRQTQAMGARMDEEFQNGWQPYLGQLIMTASRHRAGAVERTQEHIGAAVVQVAKVQAGYDEARAVNQGQIASAAIAAIRTELRADLFAQLDAAEPLARRTSVPVTEPRSWPEIPVGYLFAASIGLIGLFLAGLLLPSAERERGVVIGEIRPEPTQAYRKTA